MTRNEIIDMAREAGFQIRGDIIRTMHSSGAWVGVNKELERFAALVEARAAAAEREACAKFMRAHGMSHITVDAFMEMGTK